MKTNILVYLVALMAVFSCTNNNNSNEENTAQTEVENEENQAALPAEMEMRDWQLISYEEEEKEYSIKDDQIVTIKFNRGNIYGVGACNNYGATYTLSGEAGISFGDIGATKKICTNLMGLEQTYFKLLKASTSYEYRDAILFLSGPNQKLTFRYKRAEEEEE